MVLPFLNVLYHPLSLFLGSLFFDFDNLLYNTYAWPVHVDIQLEE